MENELSFIERSLFVEKLLSGVFFFRSENNLYKIVTPTAETRTLAEYLALEASEKLKFDELITSSKLKEELNRTGIWTFEQDKKLEASEEVVEELQLSIYRNFLNTKAKEALKKRLKAVRKTIAAARTKKTSLDAMTLEAYHGMVRDRVMVGLSIYDLNGKPCYSPINFLKQDSFLLDQAYSCWLEEHIVYNYVRLLSKTNPWRTYWDTKIGSIFSRPDCDLNSFQRHMILYSNMYDNARKSHEPPTQEVMDDDDAFDGWLVSQRKEAEKDRQQKGADAITGQRGGEVFIVADKEDKDRIYDLNTHSNRMALKNKIAEVKTSQGTIEEQNLTDVKRELRRQMIDEMQTSRKR